MVEAAEGSSILLDESSYNKTETIIKEVDHNNNMDEFVEDDASIEWEEGDSDYFHENESPRGNLLTEVDTPAAHIKTETRHGFDTDHHKAVAHTLSIIQRSGVIREGGLSVELGSSIENSTIAYDTCRDARTKLKKLVYDLTSQLLPQLNKWIHALSNADGMEERTVNDPSNADGGLVSLKLLSTEKRALRTSLLKRMLKVKGHVETTIQSANLLGTMTEEEFQHSNANQDCSAATDNSGTVPGAARKRAWLSHVPVASKPKTKKSRASKFNILYHKK